MAIGHALVLPRQVLARGRHIEMRVAMRAPATRVKLFDKPLRSSQAQQSLHCPADDRRD